MHAKMIEIARQPVAIRQPVRPLAYLSALIDWLMLPRPQDHNIASERRAGDVERPGPRPSPWILF